MKKLIASLLCLMLCLSGLYAFAEEAAPNTYKSGDYTYVKLDDGTIEISKYVGDAMELAIPEALDGIAVTSIGDSAFSKCYNLTTVTIPKSVVSIGKEAFYVCGNLAFVTIPDSVTSIGDSAFSYCVSLTSITIPSSVVSIGLNPFSYCWNLKAITVSSENADLEVLDGVLFSKAGKRLVCCPSMLSVSSYEIPQGIITVDSMAFSGCFSLNSVIVPNSVTYIGDGAFSDCFSLTSIIIAESVTFIGNDAFSGCDSLASITVDRNSCAADYCKGNGLPFTYSAVAAVATPIPESNTFTPATPEPTPTPAPEQTGNYSWNTFISPYETDDGYTIERTYSFLDTWIDSNDEEAIEKICLELGINSIPHFSYIVVGDSYKNKLEADAHFAFLFGTIKCENKTNGWDISAGNAKTVPFYFGLAINDNAKSISDTLKWTNDEFNTNVCLFYSNKTEQVPLIHGWWIFSYYQSVNGIPLSLKSNKSGTLPFVILAYSPINPKNPNGDRWYEDLAVYVTTSYLTSYKHLDDMPYSFVPNKINTYK